MTARWLSGAGVLAGIAAGWWVLYLGAVRLYENLTHAYKRRRRQR